MGALHRPRKLVFLLLVAAVGSFAQNGTQLLPSNAFTEALADATIHCLDNPPPGVARVGGNHPVAVVQHADGSFSIGVSGAVDANKTINRLNAIEALRSEILNEARHRCPTFPANATLRVGPNPVPVEYLHANTTTGSACAEIRAFLGNPKSPVVSATVAYRGNAQRVSGFIGAHPDSGFPRMISCDSCGNDVRPGLIVEGEIS